MQAILCVIDSNINPALSGWAHDVTKCNLSPTIYVIIDKETVGVLECNLDRDDLVLSSYPSTCGFRFVIPSRFFDGQPHRLELRTAAQPHAPLSFIFNGRTQDILAICDHLHPVFHSLVDDIAGSAITGWVLREVEQRKQGGQTVLVTCEGETLAQLKASQYRPDVGSAHQADSFCGFRFLPAISARKSRKQLFRFYLLPERVELQGSPFAANFITDAQQAKLAELNEIVSRLEADITAARSLVGLLQPSQRYTIEDYHEWASHYFAKLARKEYPVTNEPLVSLICPTFRPDISDFRSMAESVLKQTYQNWELIVIDDGSEQPGLSQEVDRLCALDGRIQSIVCPRNGGISVATNKGLEAARGKWIAFLDHDDLLVDVAITTMISEAQRTGALVLYSDEDKIDQEGWLSEPHFKPAFNYRLLLSNNYICHFLIVTADHIQSLRPQYDGAQDHDLILRLVERVNPSRIHHVPEVLYHWRKTETSTARSNSAKGYATAAGAQAIRDHLFRLNKPADVLSISEATFYKARWKLPCTPRVAVIIPFKDSVEITQQCMTALQDTQYANFEVLLLDNWSTSAEAEVLSRRLQLLPRTRVIRVEEPFNFSRLVNKATRLTDAGYYLLMNNDVIQHQPDWLNVMLAELLADEQVAVVGPKLVYQNGFVQHAGVGVGLGGVADHFHRALPQDAPGYAGRAMVAQEVSAVTAACMLVRAEIFHRVGGMDEEHLAVAFNDVDFCLKVRQEGYKIVFTPDVVAEHRESYTRGNDDQPIKQARFQDECRTMAERWNTTSYVDPHYSCHFDPNGQTFFDLHPDFR
jgi:O-antigen biosynthesis protein